MPPQVGGGDRQETGVAELAQQLELHLVDQRSALQRVELFEGRGLLTRRQLVQRAEHEFVGTRGEILKGGGGVRACAEIMRGQRGAGEPHQFLLFDVVLLRGIGVDEHQPVGAGPTLDPAARTEAKSAREVFVAREQIVGHPHRLALGAL